MKNNFDELIGKTINKVYLSSDRTELIMNLLEEPHYLKFKTLVANDYSMTWITEVNGNNLGQAIEQVNISDWQPISQQAWDENCNIVLKGKNGDIEITVRNSLNPNQSADYGTIKQEKLTSLDLQKMPQIINQMELVVDNEDKKLNVKRFKY